MRVVTHAVFDNYKLTALDAFLALKGLARISNACSGILPIEDETQTFWSRSTTADGDISFVRRDRTAELIETYTGYAVVSRVLVALGAASVGVRTTDGEVDLKMYALSAGIICPPSATFSKIISSPLIVATYASVPAGRRYFCVLS